MYKGYDVKRGDFSEAFKQYLRDRGLYFEPSSDGSWVHFEVEDADDAVEEFLKQYEERTRYVYEFPTGTSMQDVNLAKRLGLKYLGKAKYASGEEAYFIEGTLAELKNFAYEAFGDYELVNDYLCKADEFAGVDELKESGKFNDSADKKVEDGYIGQTLEDFFEDCIDASAIGDITLWGTEDIVYEGGYDGAMDKFSNAEFMEFDCGTDPVVINVESGEEYSSSDYFSDVEDFTECFNGDEIVVYDLAQGKEIFRGYKEECPDEILKMAFQSFDAPKFISINLDIDEEDMDDEDEDDYDFEDKKYEGKDKMVRLQGSKFKDGANDSRIIQEAQKQIDICENNIYDCFEDDDEGDWKKPYSVYEAKAEKANNRAVDLCNLIVAYGGTPKWTPGLNGGVPIGYDGPIEAGEPSNYPGIFVNTGKIIKMCQLEMDRLIDEVIAPMYYDEEKDEESNAWETPENQKISEDACKKLTALANVIIAFGGTPYLDDGFLGAYEGINGDTKLRFGKDYDDYLKVIGKKR